MVGLGALVSLHRSVFYFLGYLKNKLTIDTSIRRYMHIILILRIIQRVDRVYTVQVVHCTVDASKKSNIQAHRVATELSRLEFYPDCNQQRILRIDFN